MDKVVITGGAGFLGSQLGSRLKNEGFQVVLIDDLSYGRLDNLIAAGLVENFLCLDVRSAKLLEVIEGARYVFHFAAVAPLPDCQNEPVDAVSVNTNGTVNVLEACRRAGVERFFLASTGAIYEGNTTFPCKEDDPVNPHLVYPVSKRSAELFSLGFGTCYGLDCVIFRFFNVYGPHQDILRKQPPLIGYIIRELVAGREPRLHSDGLQRRDYIYVDDLTDLCIKSMVSPDVSGEILNVCSGDTVSVREIFAILSDIIGSEITAEYQDATHFWDHYPRLREGTLTLSDAVLQNEVNKHALGSNDKARQLTGWQPRVTMREGLEFTVANAKNLLDGNMK